MNKRIVFILSVLFWGLLGPSICYAQQQTQEQLAAQYFSNGDYAEAAELYESMYMRSSNKYYYQMLYRSYLELKQFKDAEKLVNRRIKQFPTDLSLYVDLGMLQASEGDPKKAEKSYQTAVNKLGTDSRQVADLVLAFSNVGQLDYAEAAYKAVRTKLHAPFLYVMELAGIYEQMGDYDKMTKEYFDLIDNAPGNRGSVQIALQRALNEATDTRLADGLRRTLIARVREHPDNKDNLDMMIWFALQQKDFRFALTQAKAVDSRFPELGEEQLLKVSDIAFSNGDYETACQGYGCLVKKGPGAESYYKGRVGELKAEFAKLNHYYQIPKAQFQTLKNRYESAFEELGKTEYTVPLMRDYSTLMAYHGNEVQAAADILYDILEIPRLKKSIVDEVKLELGDVLLFAGEVWDASLLYMQVEKDNKNDVIGAMAKLKNAKLSYYNNDFQWAKSQLDVLRASTSKLVANDAMQLSLLISDNMEVDSTYDMLEFYSAADIMLYRNQLDSAWILLDDISHRSLSHPLLDEVLMQKAKIRMRQGRFADADSLLQQLVDFYPADILADDALMMLGELNEDQLSNIERARSCYEKLILDYPASLYADQARKRYYSLKK